MVDGLIVPIGKKSPMVLLEKKISPCRIGGNIMAVNA